ncbi:uncharacterized protein LOC120673654 [Panicum virgatum]|jgi:hypothetical protein|uniref:Uncharacterized protein n=1 Tax=Panicum virgatum TaxID=38727 RepID=A0A8T0RLT1_PANVG|nr:uncharacterized protein LOC120673654 [Panicum virgatum]KAG2585896.1 hypothetical protein PVAP13_5NG009500 [Panicum virgatum]
MSSSMSCSPQDGDHHGRWRRPPAPLDLLDEYWFFSNTLANSNKPPRSSAKDREQHKQGSPSAGGRRLLLRTPSLPSPGVGMMEEIPNGKDDDLLLVAGSGRANRQQQPEQVEVDDDDLNWSSIYEGVLRTRMAEGGASGRSALRRAPSMPVPSSDKPPSISQEGAGGESRRRRGEVRSLSTSQQRQHQHPVPVLSRSRSVFQSSSDLESIEVQGFRDLGFVFDKEELRESLAGVLPGLKQAKSSRSRSRPYLSEAWQRRPPAPVRVQSEARSAAEMKDQLRMWAQAVACNVREEC